MSNTIAGVNLAAIAAESLQVLQSKPLLLSRISKNFSSDITPNGASITTRVPVAPSVQDISSGYSPTAISMTAYTVTCNQLYGYVVGLTDAEVTNSVVDIQRLFVQPSVVTTVNKVENALMATITNSAFSQKVTKTTAQFDSDVIADMVETLRTANVLGSLTLCISPALFANLMKDSSVKSAMAFGQGAPLPTGVVGQIHGADVIVNTNIPNNSENLVGFMCAPESLLIAARAVVVPQNFPGQILNDVEPQSGLPLQFRYWYNPDAASQPGSHNFSVATNYGVLPGVPANLVRIVTA
jgi:hypothetical protein